MALPATGFTEKTVENFIIDSATIFTDFTYDEANGFTGTPLGATSGGVTVSITMTYRKSEVDGAYVMDVKGLWQLQSGVATVQAPLKELTAENLRRSINGEMVAAAETEAPSGYQKITSKRYVEEEDYIPTVAVVGVHSGTKKQIIFVLENCLANSAMELAMTDGNEAIVTQTLQASATVEQLNNNTFPWTIYHPEAGTP